jgi:hypothetical protein
VGQGESRVSVEFIFSFLFFNFWRDVNRCAGANRGDPFAHAKKLTTFFLKFLNKK